MSDILPHVTQILRDAGLVDERWFTDEARDKGSAVHAAAALLLEGDLDWKSVDESIVGKVRQFQMFLDAIRPEILAIEERVQNDVLRYSGRLDLRVRINGREGIVDIKGIGQAPWQAIQISLYAACFDRPLARWTLHLDGDKYRLVEHKGKYDWLVAKAAITLAAWRREHGC